MALLSGGWDSPARPNEDTPVGRLLSALERRGCRYRRSGSGWQAQCPAHEDRTPSLSVREGSDGRALVHCFAGCETQEILRALGLEFRDLFAAGATARVRGSHTPR